MEKILYDKVNKRIANIQLFIDHEGNYWIDADPHGVQMSGNVTIRFLKKDNPQYEVREVKKCTCRALCMTDECYEKGCKVLQI